MEADDERVNALKSKLDEEIASESKLKKTLDQVETREIEEGREIKKLQAEIKDLASEDKLKSLQDEIDRLNRTLSQETIQNRNLSRKIDKRSKRSVGEFDLENERVRREREKSQIYIQNLQNQKDNKEKQMQLMRILLLESEKKAEIEAQRAKVQLQKVKDQTRKIYEEVQKIRNDELEKTLEDHDRSQSKIIHELQNKLTKLQSEEDGKPIDSELSIDDQLPLGNPQIGSGSTDMTRIPLRVIRTHKRRKRHKKRTHKKNKGVSKTLNFYILHYHL